MPLTPGARLGAYEIIGLLGAGGMGEVYRARDTRLNRNVAIKILPEALSTDADRVARFQREAQTLASLNHPHIAHIHGLEESGSVRALVLELVEGEDLSQRIARGPIPLHEALPIARQIAEALEAAHELGIVHRDLKPANIKITPDGKVKVLDFGLAKAFDPVAGSTKQDPAYSSNSPTITSPAVMTGGSMILGTAAYMSPEQARGKVVDKRTDIWAFGCVLYEMLIGKRPFDGEDVTAVLARIIEREPAWDKIPSNTPVVIRRLLERCLAKDRNGRLPDIAVARLDIDDALMKRDEPRTTPSARRNRIVRWVLPATAAIAVVVAADFIGRRTASHTQPTQGELVRFTVQPPAGRSFAIASSNQDRRFSISPDGRQLAIIVAEAHSRRGTIWLRPLDDLTAHPLAGADDAYSPFWSPDGKFIGFFSRGVIKKIPVSGGPAVPIATAPTGNHGSWGSRNIILFNPNGGFPPIHRVEASGGPSITLASGNSRALQTGAAFLPDGNHFLYRESVIGQPGIGEIFIDSLDSPAPRHLTHADSQAVYSAGFLLFGRGNTLMAQSFDIGSLTLKGEAIPIEDGLSITPAGLGMFSVADTGLAFQNRSEAISTLVWKDRTGKKTGTVGGLAEYSNPRLAPDQNRVAVSIRNPETRTRDIWVFDLKRGTQTHLTTDPADDLTPVWSPDGGVILFTSDRKGQRDLYRKPSSGVAQEELVLSSADQKNVTDWSPDGRFAIFHGTLGKGITLLDLAHKTPRPWRATTFTEQNGQVSSDGRWIAYDSNETGRSEVYIGSATTSERLVISSEGGMQPRWRRDGKELFYLSLNAEVMAVEIAQRDGKLELGPTRRLFDVQPSGSPGTIFDVSADGQRFLVSESASDQGMSIAVVLNWTAKLQK